MTEKNKQKNILSNKKLLLRAVRDSFIKLNPKNQMKNPVIMLVYISSTLTTVLFLFSLFGLKDTSSAFTLFIAAILWLIVLFSNFAEAISEGKGKAQADLLRTAKNDITAHLMASKKDKDNFTDISSVYLKKGDFVIVHAGEQIPADGTIIEGAASVDESAVTGESAPVIRECSSDRSAVTGGTTVTSDWIVIMVSCETGESFIDKMIELIENAARKKTKKELSLQRFLVLLAIIALLVVATLCICSAILSNQQAIANSISITSIIALLVCLTPTTIGALLSAIGIAGMSKLNQANVLVMSERAVEASGEVDVLMLDKTGSITLGNKQASDFIAVDGVDEKELADAAQLSSLADETPEGRSIVVLAKDKFSIRGRSLSEINMEFVAFSANTRMSGVNYGTDMIRKGAADSIRAYVEENGGKYSTECANIVREISNQGATPLVVAKNFKVLGVICLKDIVKQGVQEKFAALRKIGIKTIMVTGDNPLTAAAIAAEAGVDDFLAEATPEAKLKMVRKHQAEGHRVAMTGDGTSDSPALAQADVAVAMNNGTQAAKEAGNMVDLDSSPTKLIDIVRIGKQLIMTRRSLTIFSVASDIAKYLILIPALFMGLFEKLAVFNIMSLHSGESAIISAVIYTAFVILALIPLVLKGVRYREASASRRFVQGPLLHGLCGIIAPFIAIKLIDLLLVATHIVS